ncbi:MAG TPA: hypothetical protein VEK38_00970 [Candidatus Bathyarchaeia archaeon]|nr:hypothetical protein [Candidatus Bathyarchaeia archaeon]
MSHKAISLIISDAALPVFFVPVPVAKKVMTTEKKATLSVPVQKKPVKKVAQRKEEKKEKISVPQKVQKTVAKNKEPEKVEKQKVQKNIPQAIKQEEILSESDHMAALHNQLKTHWKAPIGCASCTCTITAHIGKKGEIEQMTMGTSSGKLMFDVSARSALYALHFPRWSWGRSITITFTP